MRIQGTSATTSLQKTAKKGGKSAAKGSKSDKVQVSDAAGLRERAKVMLADLPDVRLDQIEEIRNALEQGTYQMDSKAVSTYIVRNALSEHSWG